MGENSDLIIEGLVCETCGVWIDGKPSGYPRECDNCNPNFREVDWM